MVSSPWRPPIITISWYYVLAWSLSVLCQRQLQYGRRDGLSFPKLIYKIPCEFCFAFSFSAGRSERPRGEDTPAPRRGGLCVRNWGCQQPHEWAFSKSCLKGKLQMPWAQTQPPKRPGAWSFQLRCAWILDSQKLYEIINAISSEVLELLLNNYRILIRCLSLSSRSLHTC